MKSLIISHAHPDFSIGGAQVASYNLHKGIKAQEGWDSHYIAGIGPPVVPHRDSLLMSMNRAPDETLFWSDGFDWFHLGTRNLGGLMRHFERFLIELQPDVVNFHHVMGFGVEAIRAVRRALPDVPIVFTLHEYLPICANHGQMIKVGTHSLCTRATPSDCGMCFPQTGAANLLRREAYVKGFFAEVDAFVSPSNFLLSRYADWGLPPEKLVMIENGLDGGFAAPPRRVAPSGRRNQFGFFGQLNPFKGVRVLIDAVMRVPQDIWQDSLLHIYGGNLEHQPEDFQQGLKETFRQAGRRLRLGGSYKSHELPDLIREIDWLMVPSTWWENAPVVIQEAHFHGRPVIASDIGGMAEKVRDGIDGLHFRVNNANSLAATMARAIQTPRLWDRLNAGIHPPTTPDQAGASHVELFEKLLVLRQRNAASRHAAE